MTSKKILISCLLFITIVLVSCTGNETLKDKPTTISFDTETQQDPQSIQDINCVLDTLTPADVISEVLALSGDNAENQEFVLNTPATVRVYWSQSTKDEYILSIINLNPDLSDSVEKTITLESSIGASFGCVDTTLTEGNYQLVVSETSGPWKIWIEIIKYK